MNGVLERTLAILEYLAAQAEATPLALLADELEIPRSACHRLTTELVGLGLSFLATSGIVDIAQTTLDRLADLSGELVRLAIVDGDRLTWVAKAQGARKGLRYDPDMGMDTILSCSATGHAWMLTMSDERALELVSRQGFGKPKDFGPNAPTTIKALLGFLEAGRKRGYAMINEVFAPGMTAMAAPIQRKAYPTIGVISIAGPLMRLSEKRMQELGPALLAAATELAAASNSSPMFSRSTG